MIERDEGPMDDMDRLAEDFDVELTAGEKEALDRLPRERLPSDLLEERIVGSLRAEGLLASRRRLSIGGWSAPAWAAAAAAALLILSGGFIGHGVGFRSATRVFVDVHEQDAALRVQEAGTAYVASLVALELATGAAGQEEVLGQGREAAVAALQAATQVIARLDPEDPVILVLAQLLDERMGSRLGNDGVRHTIWF